MAGLFTTAIPPHEGLVHWSAREVVLELHDRPHLLTRLTITGPYFPHRSEEPYATVADRRSRFVRISEDGLRADAYFEGALSDDGEILFGYGRDIDLRVPARFRVQLVARLDLELLRRRLPHLASTLG